MTFIYYFGGDLKELKYSSLVYTLITFDDEDRQYSPLKMIITKDYVKELVRRSTTNKLRPETFTTRTKTVVNNFYFYVVGFNSFLGK